MRRIRNGSSSGEAVNVFVMSLRKYCRADVSTARYDKRANRRIKRLSFCFKLCCFYSSWTQSTTQTHKWLPGGYSTYVWVGRCSPDLEILTLFMIKSSWKSWKIDTLFYDFQVKFHSFFHQNAWFLYPVYKISSKIFEFEALFPYNRSWRKVRLCRPLLRTCDRRQLRGFLGYSVSI